MKILRAIRTACSANLLVSIAAFMGYILYGHLVQLPINENFFGMGRSHLGRGGGPMVPPWTFYALFEGLILVLFLCAQFFESKRYERTFCLIFVVLFLYGILIQHLPHRVIFPEDEKIIVVPRLEQVLMWYVWCSNAFYAVFGPNDD